MDYVIYPLLALCAVAIPAMAHRKGWKPASLFLASAFVFAFFGAVMAAYLTISPSTAGSFTSDNKVTYYIVSKFHSLLNIAIMLLIGAALLWIQQRLNPRLFLRLGLWLFWAANLALITNIVVKNVLFSMVTPKRYTDYQVAMGPFILTCAWATIIV